MYSHNLYGTWSVECSKASPFPLSKRSLPEPHLQVAGYVGLGFVLSYGFQGISLERPIIRLGAYYDPFGYTDSVVMNERPSDFQDWIHLHLK